MQRAWTLAAALVLSAAAACGGNGDDVTSRTAPPTLDGPPDELVEYCDASVVMSIVFFDAAQEVFLAPAEESEAVARTRAGELAPLVASALAEAPPEIASELATFAEAVDESAASGTFGPLDAPEVVASRDAFGAFNAETCGWPRVNLVTTGRGPVVGVPQQLGLGYHEFRIRNDSDAAHRVELYRDVDDADVPLPERFSARGPVEPRGVELELSELVPPQHEIVQLIFLQLGGYAFVVAEPEVIGATRHFAPDSATPLRVVEGG